MTHPRPPVCGAASAETPSFPEVTGFRKPLLPKPDQHGPDPISPIGSPTGEPEASRSQSGDHLATAHGARLQHRDHSLTAGHVAQAYAFERGKCYEQSIRARQRAAVTNIDTQICQRVALELGLQAPDASLAPTGQTPARRCRSWAKAGQCRAGPTVSSRTTAVVPNRCCRPATPSRRPAFWPRSWRRPPERWTELVTPCNGVACLPAQWGKTPSCWQRKAGVVRSRGWTYWRQPVWTRPPPG